MTHIHINKNKINPKNENTHVQKIQGQKKIAGRWEILSCPLRRTNFVTEQAGKQEDACEDLPWLCLETHVNAPMDSFDRSQ